MSALQPSTVDDGPAPRYYARFGARASALLVDGLLAAGSTLPGLVLLIVSPTEQQACTIDGRSSHCSVPSPGWLALAMTVVVVGFASHLAWYCLRVSHGQSVGQKASGVRVVDQLTVEPIAPWRVFARQFARLASFAVFGLGYLWMLWDPRSQTWHDKITGTIVVKA
jgi:uncharacterized RDD family membrane protein YckC